MADVLYKIITIFSFDEIESMQSSIVTGSVSDSPPM